MDKEKYKEELEKKYAGVLKRHTPGSKMYLKLWAGLTEIHWKELVQMGKKADPIEKGIALQIQRDALREWIDYCIAHGIKYE